MKYWRPDKWGRRKHDYFNNKGIDFATEERVEDFEAGADAMWEALWKKAKESPTGTFILDSNTIVIYEEEDGKDTD